MGPEPDMRPEIDEILLHPNLSQYVMGSNRNMVERTTSLPSEYVPH